MCLGLSNKSPLVKVSERSCFWLNVNKHVEGLFFFVKSRRTISHCSLNYTMACKSTVLKLRNLF